MTDTKELIARLRTHVNFGVAAEDDCWKAADALEAAEAENARLAAELASIRKQEPVGEVIREGVIRWKGLYPEKGVKLYAAPVAQPAQPDSSGKTWCEYVAGMVGCYLGEPMESDKVKAIAGIIERRLWALPIPDDVMERRIKGWNAAIPQQPTPAELQCDIEPRRLSYPLSDYHRVISEGPLHHTWQDKPHLLVYDLIAAVRYYAAPVAQTETESKLDALVRAMQADMAKYISDSDVGKDWFISQILGHLDGPQQREAQGLEP